MSTNAGDPTYMNPGAGWTVQSNAGGSGTGPCNVGVVAGELGFTSSTVNGVQQAAVGGAAGPMSATYADPSGTGAHDISYEKTLVIGNIPMSHPTDAIEGVY